MKARVNYMVGMNQYDRSFEHEFLYWHTDENGNLHVEYEDKKVATYRAGTWNNIQEVGE